MVHLTPMTKTAFEKYLVQDTQRYAAEQVKAGHWQSADALEKSQSEHARLLPDGMATKNHYLCSIRDRETNSQVGIIWFHVRPKSKSAFIYDFVIAEKFRRKGYGAQTLQALEETVKPLGVKKIALHVFAHNKAARASYEKMGYKGTGTEISKLLGEEQ